MGIIKNIRVLSRTYKFINEIIEEKIPILKENHQFNTKYEKLMDLIDQLDQTLENKQKEQFNELIKLFYDTEEYYFALAYSLGIKYGEDIEYISTYPGND